VCVIVKHANPCGVAVGATIDEAYDKALASDPTSAYGGIVVVNREVGPELGERIAAQFVEVVFAPGYSDEALAALRRKQGTRILLDRERRRDRRARDYKRVIGGLLVQDPDATSRIAKAGRSSAGRRTSGNGAISSSAGGSASTWRRTRSCSSRICRRSASARGQMSRVDAVGIAIEKAAAYGHDMSGAALASDAFFPFADGPRLALDAGIGSIVQPGGSRRDAEVVEAVVLSGAAMVFTGRRHFRH
jgi:phosphoribosylaminoimidazolecarboxamide formyltransferase/IMP cyclohydrolase